MRSLDGELLNCIRRKTLQEAADIIVGIVHPVHRKHIIQAGAAAEGNSGDARLGGIGGLHRFGPRHQVSDVGETAFRERNGFEIPRSHHAAVYGAGDIHRLRSNGRGRGGDVHLLLRRRGIHDDVDIARGADADRHCGIGISKAWSLDGYTIIAGREISQAEFSALVTLPAVRLRIRWLE